jgi:glycosyltransferase involved in cell wall biosynthesis
MLDPYHSRRSVAARLKRTLFWPLQYLVLRGAAAVLFTSDEEMSLARRSHRPYHVVERTIAYAAARPPVNRASELETFLNHYPALRSQRYILYLGRLHPKKGLDILIRAYASISACKEKFVLVLAGPDHDNFRSKLMDIAREEGVTDRIVWTGMLRGELKYGALEGAEAFALPSHQENFGIAVAEALGCGKPVLISDRVNIWRKIVAAKAGLVAPDTFVGVTRLLREWMALSPADRLEMGASALACYEQNFTVEQSTTDILSALSDPVVSAPTLIRLLFSRGRKT